MLLSLFNNAGIVRYPLLICSVLAVALILERLWTLAMLEAWLRVFVDGRGKQPRGFDETSGWTMPASRK